MKKDKAIIFIVNKSYLFALGTMIINLQETRNNIYDEIVIYYDGLDNFDLDQIRKIEPRVKFIEYKLVTWEEEHIKVTSPIAKQFLDRYSHLAWSKYKVIEQLENYNKILYLDVDMLIKGDISEIFKLDGFAWRSGNNFNLKFGNKEKYDEIKNIPNNTPTPNGGLIYASNINNIKLNLQDAKNFLIKNLDKFTGGLDELVFGWIVYKNNLKLTELEPFVYNTFPQMLKPETKIVHFMGSDKPWNSDIMQTIFPQWLEYYKNWVKQGGKDSDKVVEKNNFGGFISSALNQRRWLDFFDKTNLKLPQSCKLTKDLSKEWLIIEYNEFSYYEFKFNQYLPGYQIGYWIKEKSILNDSELLEKIKKINLNNNLIFKIKKDDRGIYIHTDRISESKIPAIFDYFFRKTSTLI